MLTWLRLLKDICRPGGSTELEGEAAYGSLASIIRSDLREVTEPNGDVPRGTYSDIARRRGCTTSYVSTIARKEGFRVRRT